MPAFAGRTLFRTQPNPKVAFLIECAVQRKAQKVNCLRALRLLLKPFEIFIAGCGRTGIIVNARDEIRKGLLDDANKGKDILAGHKGKIETILGSIHRKYVKGDQDRVEFVIIIIAPHAPGSAPLLYRTEGAMSVSEPFYAAEGSGKTISDYFADRLYRQELSNDMLALLAAFICREAEYKASGVGLGFDMIFIHDGDSNSKRIIAPDYVRELLSGIPSLNDTIFSYWKEHATVPAWFAK
jgi:hypothetical protein